MQYDNAAILQKNLLTVQHNSTLLLLHRVRAMVMIIH
jgi:hypothetical protein